MAARWGAGEEILTACNMDFFPLNTLDQAAELHSEDSMEALQNCLDPSILSIFEDSASIETKGIDEESEATLLTALTEILDNVDEENLSPFDTLPESDLLSGQRGTDHSPLRRLLSLPRSSPEKDALCMSRPFSVGKTLPKKHPDALQRSDGEEEEDCSLTQSPVEHDLLLDNNLLDWEGLTLPLPVTFEQETDEGGSISLGDLVRHMHPYCMAICVENDDGQQMLPEGGILLEVVDQGENGEPILAIPDMDFTASLPIKEQTSENDQTVSDKTNVASDSTEHIVVDDDEDETLSKPPVKVQTPDLCSDVIGESITEGHKEKIKATSPPHRKKKKKCKKLCSSDSAPVQRRVLRSASRKSTTEVPTKQEKNLIEGKKSKVTMVTLSQKNEIHAWQTEMEPEITSTALPADGGKLSPSMSSKDHTFLLSVNYQNTQPICTFEEAGSLLPKEMPKQMVQAPGDFTDQTSPVASWSSVAPTKCVATHMTPAFSESLPPVAPVIPEPKPKSLSLEEYRRLRRQKKPDPPEKQHNNRTKWPSLPELPTELPPIPCLPDPSPRDPRRSQPPSVLKEADDIKPAWQPRGPCAPPTPEALLVPPSYMAASSSKVSSAPAVSQQAPQSKSDITSKPNRSQNLLETVPSTVNTVPTYEATNAHPAVHFVPQSSECQSIIQPIEPMASDKMCSTVLTDRSERFSHPPVSIAPVELSTKSSETTTETIKSTVATVPISSCPQKMVISQQVPDIIDSTSSQCTFAESAAHLSSSAPPFVPKSEKQESVLVKEKNIAATKCCHAKSPTQELIESFTSEIGIEAADLTSLLEQFEENQAKEEQGVLEVSVRAAAVGNSRVELPLEKTVVERVRAKDALGTAALTPPATPPHQMWKPLVSVTLKGKNRTTESMPSASKVIQIEARPLSSVKSRCKPTAPTTITPEVACMDHDYCLPTKVASPKESVKRWNVKQQSFITIKPIRHPTTATLQTPPPASESSEVSSNNLMVTTATQGILLPKPFDHRANEIEKTSILDSPDASPAQQDDNDALVEEVRPRKGPFGRSYHWHATSHTPSSRTSPKDRTGGRYRKRSHLSPSPRMSCSDSDSHSSRSRSRSCSPAEKRYRSHRSQSSSISSSRSSSQSSSSASPSPPRRRNHSYSSSRSGSWSRSRSRSPQRHTQCMKSRSRRLYSPSYKRGNGHCAKTNTEDTKRRKEKAIEERRVVYVGRIRGTMTQRELKERFSYFGEIEECTLHFRDHGDNYGFVTYYNTKDAFTAIENGGKLRKPDELPFDLCFGGRRQFCQTSYSDLDSNREYDPLAAKGKYNALDFDTLLKQAQQNLKR